MKQGKTLFALLLSGCFLACVLGFIPSADGAETTSESNDAEQFSSGILPQDSYQETSWRYADGIARAEQEVRANSAVEGEKTSPDLEQSAPFSEDALSLRLRSLDAWDNGAYEKVGDYYTNGEGAVIVGAIRKGIDVSEHNGYINWEAVKADGIEFVIIRCGYGNDLEKQDDKRWAYNIQECNRLNIPYGVYLYSYATDTAMAQSEAAHTLRLLESAGADPAYPVFLDMEDDRTAQLGSSTFGDIAETYCRAISSAGYTPGIYANTTWWNTKLTDSRFDNWFRWVAQWHTHCTYQGSYGMWQCTSDAQVAGISGRVDLNLELANVAGKGKFQLGISVSQQNWVEGELPYAPQTKGNIANGAETYEYFSDAALSIPVPSMLVAPAGTYYVKVTVAETQWYAPATAVKEFMVVSNRANIINKFSGADRYETNRALVNTFLRYEVPQGFIVVTADSYPDALSASGLAGLLGYPIVLTSSKTLSDAAFNTACDIVARNNGENVDVLIVGGEVSVSADVESALAAFDKDGKPTRIAGESRAETAEKVYMYGGIRGGWGTAPVLIASGNSYPDALTVSAYAASKQAPILLATGDLTFTTQFLIQQHGANALILGGFNSVSEEVGAQLEQLGVPHVRLAGDNRYQTSLEIVKWELDHGMSANGIGFATGANFPDALGASPYLKRTTSVLALISPNQAENEALYKLVAHHADSITTINVFGGVNSIGVDARNSLVGSLGWRESVIMER